MQKLLLLLLFAGATSPAFAQFKVLFVDDSGDTFGNAELLASALDSLGYDYVYIDAIGTSTNPSVDLMNDFDLVIWHTSTWGLGLQFWEGNDTDNGQLIQYLSQPGANLWLIGNDFLYDRYGPAPADFQAGDFVYDYLGITKYATQSYINDGNQGVPLMVPAPGQPIPGLADISWQFGALWYADGLELRPEATPVYLFGDNSYVLAGQPTGVYFHPAGGARILTYAFDLALANGYDQVLANVDSVLVWWQNNLSATGTPVFESASVKATPNAFSDQLDIRVNVLQTAPVSIRICRADGQLVTASTGREPVNAGEEYVWHWQVPAGLPPGMYFCTVQSGNQVRTVRVVKM